MSASAPTDDHSLHAATPSPGVVPQDAETEARLLQATRDQIRSIVQEITQLAAADIDEDQFFSEFLKRVVSALASSGAAIWIRDGQGPRLRYAINPPPAIDNADNARRHGMLIGQLLAEGQPTLVPPRSGVANNSDAGNPTEHLLICGVVRVEDRPLTLIEVFGRAAAGPTTQRGYLRFLIQMCELAETYLTRRRLRTLQARASDWERLERFIGSIHQGLDLRQACFALVNDARPLIACDRVSVALRRGSHYRVQAVSGLDSLDRRSAEIKRLERLATRVASAGDTLWRTDNDQEELPPQIVDAWEDYLDASHARLVVVRPLFAADPEADENDRTAGEPLAVLIAEQLQAWPVDPGKRDRVDTIARHAGSALANAVEHDRVFLLPVWKFFGRLGWLVRARQLPKTLAACLLMIGVVAALAMVRAPMKLTCQGQLLPSHRKDVFAQTEGVVAELPVRHGQAVEPGDLLVRLRSAALTAKRTRLEGELDEKQQQYQAGNAALLRNERLDPVEQQRIEGDLRQLEKAISNLKDRIRLIAAEERTLTVRSTARAQIATWRLRERLEKRPVRRGEVLMTLFDPDGPWELELWMPERRMGQIETALSRADAPLPVSFVLASHPNVRLRGELVERQRTADVHPGEGNIVRMRVRVDKSELPELRNEASLTAQVHCGDEPIGVVWFGDFFESVRKAWLLWGF